MERHPIIRTKSHFQVSRHFFNEIFRSFLLEPVPLLKRGALQGQEPSLSCSLLCLHITHMPRSMLAREIDKEDQKWFYLEISFSRTSELQGEYLWEMGHIFWLSWLTIVWALYLILWLWETFSVNIDHSLLWRTKVMHVHLEIWCGLIGFSCILHNKATQRNSSWIK